MTRFVVDCGVVLHLVSEGIDVPAEHELLAPTLLRSQTLSALHEAVHRGELPPGVGRDLDPLTHEVEDNAAVDDESRHAQSTLTHFPARPLTLQEK